MLKRRYRETAVLLILAAVACSVASSQDQRLLKPRAAPKPQPIPFSHKLHTKFIKQCGDCHQIREDEMTLPPDSQCMQCHATIGAQSPAIKKLAAFYKERKPVPWVKVYTLPDYVYFSHADHTKAKVGCEVCHGPVAERDVITKEKPTSMTACMDCHREKGAPVRCDTCHNPNP